MIKQKKTRVGLVTSDKMTKTVAVQVERRIQHPQFKKYITRSKKFLAHDEKGEAKKGDLVEIAETRPLSRRKSWEVVKILKKGVGEVVLKEEIVR